MSDLNLTNENLNRLITELNNKSINNLSENDHILIYNYMLELKRYRDTNILIKESETTNIHNTIAEEQDNTNNTLEETDLLYVDPALFEHFGINSKKAKPNYFRRKALKKTKMYIV